MSKKIGCPDSSGNGTIIGCPEGRQGAVPGVAWNSSHNQGDELIDRIVNGSGRICFANLHPAVAPLTMLLRVVFLKVTIGVWGYVAGLHPVHIVQVVAVAVGLQDCFAR